MPVHGVSKSALLGAFFLPKLAWHTGISALESFFPESLEPIRVNYSP